MRRPGRWLLVPVGADRFDVVRSGRRVASDLSLVEATRYVGRHAMLGDVMHCEEEDGYRSRLSLSGAGRGNR